MEIAVRTGVAKIVYLANGLKFGRRVQRRGEAIVVYGFASWSAQRHLER